MSLRGLPETRRSQQATRPNYENHKTSHNLPLSRITPGSLTLFPYQNPQGCHAARRTQDDGPSKAVARDVLVALLRSIVGADDAVGNGAVAAAAVDVVAAVDDDGDDDGQPVD